MTLNRLTALFESRLRGNFGTGEKISLFLGAGADIASGGLSFSQLKRQALSLYGDDVPTSLASELLVDHRFQELFESISTPTERADLVEAIFRLNQECSPSDAYRMIVLLAQQGIIDAVVTTNFDTMLEAAQSELGLNIFQTFAAGQARPFPVTATSRLASSLQVPYIKIHGCIGARAVTHITTKELEKPKYDASLMRLLKDTLQNAHVVFLGYSGFDAGLVNAIRVSFSKHSTSLYFCNPTPPDKNAPLVTAAGGLDKFIVIETNFSQAIEGIAKPILQKPHTDIGEPVYIDALFKWRIDYASRNYARDHEGFGTHNDSPVIVRRRVVEEQLDRFLVSARPLAVVVGQSGYGKSTLGTRCKKQWSSNDTSVLLLEANRFVSANFEDEISNVIGTQSQHGVISLQTLQNIMRRRSQRLIIYLDGINEFDNDVGRCIQLFKSILRFCAYADDFSRIRIVITIRTESWAIFQRMINQNDLERVMWSPAHLPNSIAAIGIGKLTDDEFDDALVRINETWDTNYSRQRMAPAVCELLRDPFLLSIAAEQRLDSWVLSSSSLAMEQLFRRKIERTQLIRSPDEIISLLASSALDFFETRREGFDIKVLHDHHLDSNTISALKDAGIFINDKGGRVKFTHDRIHEFFLARGFGLAAGPSIETLEDLKNTIIDFAQYPKLLSALRLHLLLEFDNKAHLVDRAMLIASQIEQSNWSHSIKQKVITFCREILIELAVDQPEKLSVRFREVLDERFLTKKGDDFFQYYLSAASFLPSEIAIKVLPLTEKLGEPTSTSVIESNIYSIDKFTEIFLEKAHQGISLIDDEPFKSYFGDSIIGVYRQVGRLLGLASQLGPDNQHPEEYEATTSAIMLALNQILSNGIAHSEIDKVINFILSGKDRYLFNASEFGISRFFKNQKRNEFLPIWKRLSNGECVEASDFEIIRPYIETLDHDLEFQLSNFIFILSALNDFEQTILVWEQIFNAFNRNTHPHCIDFMQAVIPHIFVCANQAYDDVLYTHIERVLKTLPHVLEYHPGQSRGASRGFKDPHDQVFEDGFNPIACYCYLLPSEYRRSMLWNEYIKTDWSEKAHPVPLFDKYLTSFIEDQDEGAALRIVHALSQFCILWPKEGLEAIKGLLGVSNPSIRRSVIRVLAEMYNRYPIETQKFLATSGSHISDKDLQNIRINKDARIGKRQFEGLQWSRILHLLLQFPDAKKKLANQLCAIYAANSLEDGVISVFEIAGVDIHAEK